MAEPVVQEKKTGKIREIGKNAFRAMCVIGEPIANALGGTLDFLAALPSPYKALGRMECNDVRKTLIKLIKDGESLEKKGDFAGAWENYYKAYDIMESRRIGMPHIIFMKVAEMGGKAHAAGQLGAKKPVSGEEIDAILKQAAVLEGKKLFSHASKEYARAYDLMEKTGASEESKNAVYLKMMETSASEFKGMHEIGRKKHT